MRSHEDPPTASSAPDEPIALSALPQLTQGDCIQVLEVLPGDVDGDVTVTFAIAARAIQAICMALSEQLDRAAQERVEHVENILMLREHTTLVERLRPLVAGEGHAVFPFSHAELRTCLLELTRYTDRVDDGHHQDPDLRARLETIRRVIPVLWEANAAAAATTGGPTRREPRRPA